jgi:MoaA/NifB/PqqE/SkfB family radical SAM enzyme
VSRIVIELTSRCNLHCSHCFGRRHDGTAGDLPFHILTKILLEAKSCGIDHVSFSGGEPTLYPRFGQAASDVVSAGCTFSLVTNGTRLPQLALLLRETGASCTGVTFSLDGADEATHDRLRGTGSFRQVMRGISVCAVGAIPFTINFVVTAGNRHEVSGAVDLATRLGSRGIRFGHLMPTADTAVRGLDLSLAERRAVESEIWRLRRSASIPVAMAAGHYSANPFFLCAPLQLQEFNVDCRGNLTLCCQLSGHSPAIPTDIVANLGQTSLVDACARFRDRVQRYLDDKRNAVDAGDFHERDRFPCLYCIRYLGKVPSAGVQQAGWSLRAAGAA